MVILTYNIHKITNLFTFESFMCKSIFLFRYVVQFCKVQLGRSSY